MKLLVKKFSLRYNGVVYHAGQVVEMASEEALALAKAAPLEFEAIADNVEEKAFPTGSENALQEQEKQPEILPMAKKKPLRTLLRAFRSRKMCPRMKSLTSTK